jgi:hypothetical protein
MPADSAQIALERVLAAVGECLDRQSDESLLRLRADTEMQGRIEELADKCTDVPAVITYLQAGLQRIYAFVKGANGHLSVNYYDGFVWHWADQGVPTGTTVADVPGVVTYLQSGKQLIYAFIRCTNGHLGVNCYDGSAWHWADQGVPPGTR